MATGKVLYGKDAVKKAEQLVGRPLTYAEKRVVEEEGYSQETYKDTKGIETSGFGFTGDFMGMPFDKVFEVHEKRLRGKIKNLDSLPEEIKAELIQAEYRGDVNKKYKWVKLFNEGKYEEASKEFLDNNDYRKSIKEKTGVAGRMRKVSSAISSLKANPQFNNLPPIGSGSTYSMTPQQMESKVYPPTISDAPYPEVSDRYKMELLSKPNVNSPAGVKRVQAQIGADVDGVWGKQSQDLFDMHNRQAYDNKVRPPSDTYRQEGFQRQAPRNPSLVEQGVNAIIPSAQAAAMPVAPPEKQYMTMEELLIDKDLMQNPLLFNDADAKRMWERF
jgi:GH24 family phage-related lysozyme (muramidase)